MLYGPFDQTKCRAITKMLIFTFCTMSFTHRYMKSVPSFISTRRLMIVKRQGIFAHLLHAAKSLSDLIC